MYLSRDVVEIVFNGRWICIYSTVDTIVCISIGNEAWTWRNQTCTTHLRTARGHMTRRRRPQNFGKTLIRKHIYQKTRIRCFVAVCLAAPRSFVYNCRRSSQGDSPPHNAAPPPITSGFLLALRRIRIHSGGVLLSSHRAPSHHPPLNMN